MLVGKQDAPERFVPLPPLPTSEEGYDEGDEREGGEDHARYPRHLGRCETF